MKYLPWTVFGGWLGMTVLVAWGAIPVGLQGKGVRLFGFQDGTPIFSLVAPKISMDEKTGVLRLESIRRDVVLNLSEVDLNIFVRSIALSGMVMDVAQIEDVHIGTNDEHNFVQWSLVAEKGAVYPTKQHLVLKEGIKIHVQKNREEGQLIAQSADFFPNEKKVILHGPVRLYGSAMEGKGGQFTVFFSKKHPSNYELAYFVLKDSAELFFIENQKGKRKYQLKANEMTMKYDATDLVSEITLQENVQVRFPEGNVDAKTMFCSMRQEISRFTGAPARLAMGSQVVLGTTITYDRKLGRVDITKAHATWREAQGQWTQVKGDRMSVYLDSLGTVQDVRAVGNVTWKFSSGQGLARRLRYGVKEGIVVLEGMPATLWDGGRKVEGAILRYHPFEKRVEISRAQVSFPGE